VSPARLSKPLRKTPYYARALASLCRAATMRSVALCLFRRRKRLDLRGGGSLHLDTVLDLLVVQEALLADVYGLAAIDEPEGSVVDVGAGIGAFTLAAARRFPRAPIHAFEPNPRTFALLQQNVRAAGLTEVKLGAVAVGTAPDYVLDVAAGPRTMLRPSGGSGGLAVPGARLDEVVPAGPIGLLKVDCEGLELDVLATSTGVLPAVEHVVVEYHRHLLEDADRRVAAFLTAHGFDVTVSADPYEPSIGYVSGSRPGRSVAPPAAGTAAS
jgi:FkbM family methyltransferase